MDEDFSRVSKGKNAGAWRFGCYGSFNARGLAFTRNGKEREIGRYATCIVYPEENDEWTVTRYHFDKKQEVVFYKFRFGAFVKVATERNSYLGGWQRFEQKAVVGVV